MAYPSYAPVAKLLEIEEEAHDLIARPQTKLRLSRMPASFAVVSRPMPLVSKSIKVGKAENDDGFENVDEDELFAIWQARLL